MLTSRPVRPRFPALDPREQRRHERKDAIALRRAIREAGVELHVIQRRLGHSSIRSTMRYLHLAHDKTSATPSPLDLIEFPRLAQS